MPGIQADVTQVQIHGILAVGHVFQADGALQTVRSQSPLGGNMHLDVAVSFTPDQAQGPQVQPVHIGGEIHVRPAPAQICQAVEVQGHLGVVAVELPVEQVLLQLAIQPDVADGIVLQPQFGHLAQDRPGDGGQVPPLCTDPGIHGDPAHRRGTQHAAQVKSIGGQGTVQAEVA